MSILTNVIALETENALNATQSSIATSIRRLSTGLRINSAQDDPAGLAISNRMQAELKGLNQAAANANTGISMLQTADGGLSSTTQSIEKIRTLAVQAANGTMSASDVASIQAQITEELASMQQSAMTTQYNGITLNDGSLSNVQFQVGANAGQTISFGIGSAQTKDLGNNLVSLTGADTNALNGAISNAGARASAGTSVNNVAAQTLTLQGNGTTQTVAVTANESAQAIAAAINAGSAKTGIEVNASTTATMTFTTAGTQSFTLNGLNGNPVAISTNWTATTGYSAAVDAINQQTGNTGVTATLNGANGITLTNTTGANLVVNNTSATNTISLAGQFNSGTQAAPVMSAGTAVILAVAGAGNLSESTVGGNLSFSSQGGYSVTSDTVAGLFAVTTANASTLNSIGSIDVTTVAGANAAIAIADASIGQVNTQRGLLGALQNRFTNTVSNLETAALNLTASLSTVRDANFAGETTNLATEQILSQAATAMLAQANQLPGGVLALLR